jgi:DNA-binding transcriptional regulator YdaS (Cro superfamily)
MESLRSYLNSLTVDQQHAFAVSCGTTVGYLRKAISKNQRFDAALVVAIERESSSVVRCEDLRPDVDWRFLRRTETPNAA